ncbi:MAG: MATE family efflux transporter, partial [Erysipelotrichaceae bacterium]|nr:MATE family efflux transporter [Erysipelotrichaceae bacterium]
GLVSVVAIIYLRPIALFLGATEALIDDCITYGRIILSFNIAFMLQCAFQSFMVTAQKPQLGLYFTIGAGVMNMVMDALLVGYFKLGVVGAASATVLSQCVGGIIPLIYFCFPNDSLLRITKPKMDMKVLWETCSNGASEFVNNISTSVVSIVYNFQLLRYLGPDGVAAYGVLMYVSWIFFAVLVGYTVGSAPIISFHYGAQNHEELRNLLKKSLIVITVMNVGLTLLGILVGKSFVQLYVGYDSELCAIALHGFRLFILAFLCIGYNMFSSSFFTALNNGPLSALISFLRVFGFQLIAVIGLPLVLGIDGIWLAGLVADLLCMFVSGYFIIKKRSAYGY